MLSGNHKKKAKWWIIFILKSIVVVLPIYLLVEDERFNFQQQVNALTNLKLLLSVFAFWSLSVILLVAFRWQIVSKIFHLELSFVFATKVHSAGIFLSTWLPGGIGGDVWKAYSFGKQMSTKGDKHLAYLSVVLDRILGLYAIILIGAAVILIDAELWLSGELAYPALSLVGTFFILTIVAFVTIILPLRAFTALKTIATKLPFSRGLLSAMTETIVLARQSRLRLLLSLGLSIIIQIINVLILKAIVEGVTGQSLELLAIAGIFSTSLIAIVISLAPSGIGVGHYLYDKLFLEFGVLGGADIYNCYLITGVLFSLIGVAPFLFSGVNISNNILKAKDFEKFQS